MPDPGLFYHTAHRLEQLADWLAPRLNQPLAAPPGSALPGVETVVVPTQGIGAWLRPWLAQRHGVLCNYNFSYPNAWFASVVGDWLGLAEPPAVPSTADWTMALCDALPAWNEHPEFGPVHRYLAGGDDRHRLQLAQRLADAFDRYTIYRPAVVMDWQRGGSSQSAWQALLWRSVIHRNPRLADHPAAWLDRMARQRPVRPVPDTALLFGFSHLPPVHRLLLQHLASHTAVHLFVLQPSGEFFSDAVTPATAARRRLAAAEARLAAGHGDDPLPDPVSADELPVLNPLVETMGQQIGDFAALLLEDGWNPESEAFDAVDPASTASPPDHLPAASNLQRLQLSVLRLEPSFAPQPVDHSLQFHLCHSPLREVEVLRDCLLDQFARLPDLRPRDIIVLAPDIATYAPYIHAVFNRSSAADAAFLPYSVADTRSSDAQLLIDTLFALLALPVNRFAASDILRLLESPPIANRFAFEEQELSRIRDWIQTVNIRWGRDAAHRSQLGLPQFDTFSWRHGLQNLALGFAFNPTMPQLVDGAFPANVFEGQQAWLFDRLLRAFDCLCDYAAAFAINASWAEWHNRLTKLCDDLLAPDSANPLSLALIHELIAPLAGDPTAPQSATLPVSWSAVLDLLRGLARIPNDRGGFVSGGITFASLTPMRSVPARVIGLLGMADGSLPRLQSRPAFDLMDPRKPKPGDTDSRASDRLLYLETVLSARDSLIISWPGISQAEGVTSAPNIPTCQLLEFLHPGCPVDRHPYVTRHRLHAFHPDYFATGNRLFSYSVAGVTTARAMAGLSVDPQPGVPDTLPAVANNASLQSGAADASLSIDLQSLLSFWRNPRVFYLKDVLKLRLPSKSKALSDSESLDPNNLEQYQLRQSAHQLLLTLAFPQELRPLLEARGDLVPGIAGDRVFRDLMENLQPFIAEPSFAQVGESPIAGVISCTRVESACPVYVSYSIPATNHNIPRVIPRYSKLKADSLILAWLHHLCLTLSAHPNQQINLLAVDKRLSFQVLDQPSAQNFLADLVAGYIAGTRAPLPFAPESSHAAAESLLKGNDKAAAIKAAVNKWQTKDKFEGEVAKLDPYQDFVTGVDWIDDTFVDWATRIWSPILNHKIEVAVP
jgi:exodeoxyribonuclease V gamma subunit